MAQRMSLVALHRLQHEQWGSSHAVFGARFTFDRLPTGRTQFVWTCAAGHTWQNQMRNDGNYPGLCRDCPRDCRTCKRSFVTREFVEGRRLLQTCTECRALLKERRQASAAAVRAEKLRLQPLRPESRMDEMDDDVLLAIVMRAHAAQIAPGRNVMLVARGVCRKFDRVTFEYARQELRLRVARCDVVWFASELRPILCTDLQLERRLGVPQCILRAARVALGHTLTMADGIREALRLYGTRSAVPRGCVNQEARVLARLATRVQQIDEAGVLGPVK